jgi:hypothetical protein
MVLLATPDDAGVVNVGNGTRPDEEADAPLGVVVTVTGEIEPPVVAADAVVVTAVAPDCWATVHGPPCGCRLRLTVTWIGAWRAGTLTVAGAGVVVDRGVSSSGGSACSLGPELAAAGDPVGAAVVDGLVVDDRETWVAGERIAPTSAGRRSSVMTAGV